MSIRTTAPCASCEQATRALSFDEARERLANLPQWDIVEEEGKLRIARTYPFPDFRAALAFTDQVGGLAESVGHHPEITTEWGHTTVKWWTHKVGGLDEADFIMAARTDRVYEG